MKIEVYNNHATRIVAVATGGVDSDYYAKFILPYQSAEVDVEEGAYVIQVLDGNLTFIANVYYSTAHVQHVILCADGNTRTGGVDYTGVPSTLAVPVIGTVTVPSWAVGNADAAAFFFGFSFAAAICLFRACLRWFRRVGADTSY